MSFGANRFGSSQFGGWRFGSGRFGAALGDLSLAAILAANPVAFFTTTRPDLAFETAAGTTPVSTPGQGSPIALGKIVCPITGRYASALGADTTRPLWSARYNRILNSDLFATSVVSGFATSSNQPDAFGTAQARKFTCQSDSVARSYSGGYFPVQTIRAGVMSRVSFYIKPLGLGNVIIAEAGNAIFASRIALSTGTTQLSGIATAVNVQQPNAYGYYLVKIWLYSSTSKNINISHTPYINGATTSSYGTATYIGDGSSAAVCGIDLRDVRMTSVLPEYQRVGSTLHTYDTSGFPIMARADGIDDVLTATVPNGNYYNVVMHPELSTPTITPVTVSGGTVQITNSFRDWLLLQDSPSDALIANLKSRSYVTA